MFDKGYFIGGGTGTLPSNSLTEVFNMMRLFCPDLLHNTQTEHFDSWLGQYGEITTSLEFTSTGGIKSKTRVASFKNLWELMSSLSLFTDFVTADSAKIERPILHRHTITAPMNGTQLAITQNIKSWMERWQRKQPVSYCKADGTLVAHNPLTLTSLGSLSSIDSRLVEPNAVVHKETKLHQLIHNVLWIYRATDECLGTQIIFSDSGVPKGIKHGEFNVENSDVSKGIKCGEIELENSDVPKTIKCGEIDVENSDVLNGIKRGKIELENSTVPQSIKRGKFDVYNYIKDTLVALGIPANQIAFIHEFDTEAKRLKLYDNVNRGRIRILLGSTLKAGTGINVQRLCIALHHLDLSWTPANLIQRRGRGHRQGNLWPEIWEFTYGTSGLDNSPGFDAYKANLVRLKAEMSYRIMSGNVRERHCEDVGEDASHFLMAAAILSGNSAALNHAKITSKIRQKEADLVNQQTTLGKGLYALKTLAQDRMDLEAELTAASDDLAKVMAAGDLKGEGFRCEVQGIKYDSVEQAGNALIQVIYRIIQGKEACFDYEIGEIAGLGICVTYIGGDSIQYVRLRGAEFPRNSVKQHKFYHLGNWNTGRGLISCLRDVVKDIKGENNSGITIAENLTKKLSEFNLDAERLPERVERLTQVVNVLKDELAPLKVEELRLRQELVKVSESEEVLSGLEILEASSGEHVSEILTASAGEDVSETLIASAGEHVSEISTVSAGENVSEISTVSAGENVSEISTVSAGENVSEILTASAGENVSEISTVSEAESAEKLQAIDYTEEDLVPAPGAALYFGADEDIVEYILSIGEPTTVDEEGNLVTWIDRMRCLKLKADVANPPSIEEAKQQLEKTLELKTEEKGKSDVPKNPAPCSPSPLSPAPKNPTSSPPTPYSKKPTPFHIQEIRQIISVIGLSEESLNRVMANLTTRIKEELGLLKLDGEKYLWETVGFVQQGRLF